ECVELAERLAERIGSELAVPTYLYAEAARTPKRRRLPDIREGEYEALEEKLKKPEFKPDFGPVKFNAKAGATAFGARNFLIAYNVNLNTTSVKLAKRIAFQVREKGGYKRGKRGAVLRGKDGKPLRGPGMFKQVQGTAWFIEEYGRAQITVNILDIDASPLHKVYDACCDLAHDMGLRVTGSEIVGMVPRRVLTEAGRYFLKKQGSTTGVSRDELARVGVMSLGLSDVSGFDPQKKIIEEQFMEKTPLVDSTLKGFTEELASNSAAPGGGSVAALAGALGAGLSSMVGALTFEKKGFEKLRGEMEKLGVEAQRLKELQLAAIDADTEAFKKVLEGMRRPKDTKVQKAARAKAVLEASKHATIVPLETLERAKPTLELAAQAARMGNPNSLSDAGVAALMGRAAALGAYFYVLINLAGIDDKPWCRKIRAKADNLLDAAQKKADQVDRLVLETLRAQAPK
ncbi:MAG: formimidoyltransferase-cyclodeaminase, partial [Elusimicrobiota bacterium]